MSLPEPRGRMYQDDDFRVEDVVGTVVERMLGLVTDQARGPFLFLMRPAGRHWQRFFLDAGIGVWEEWSDASVEDDLEDCEVIDLGATLRLCGQTVEQVVCEPGPRLCITLSSGVFSIRSADPLDLDAPTVVEYRAGA